MNPLRPCPDCGTPTRDPYHCRPKPRRRRQRYRNKPAAQRNYQDERQRQRILKQWRATYGNICPGTPWCDRPNLIHRTRDLTVDHTKPQSQGGTLQTGWTVMCRTANSRKRNRADAPPKPPPPHHPIK